MPKEESREVRRAIRRAFVEVWDPIRVMEDPEWPRDEYDAYIGRVFELLVTGGSDREIIEYLLLAEEGMGMDGSRANLQTVTAALGLIPIPRVSDQQRPQ
ncbi:MAG TPA: hypothetical protein VIX90_17000 [Edaphobacter sp.]